MNNLKFEPHVKGGFSERKGIKDFSSIVQTSSLDSRTRNKLFSSIRWYFEKSSYSETVTHYVYTEIFSLIEENIPKKYNVRGAEYYDIAKVTSQIYHFFETSEYNEIFDFLEAFIRFFNTPLKRDYNGVQESINKIFKEENVNFRLVNGIITDLVNEIEIESIDNTLNSKYDVVNKHFSNALDLLYHAKDYDNSIKESISSVEAMCQIVTGIEKATLGDALKKLKNDVHPALKGAFEKLYGYTSDANGIRHANGLNEGDSTIEEARYMLVSCSAFINYLKEKFEEKERENG